MQHKYANGHKIKVQDLQSHKQEDIYKSTTSGEYGFAKGINYQLDSIGDVTHQLSWG